MSIKIKRFVILSSLILNVSMILFIIGKRIYYQNSSYFNPQETSQQRLNKYLTSNPDTSTILFVGTSITAGFPLFKEFQNNHYINLGFAGATNHNLTGIIEQAIRKKPRAIVLESGINDIRYRFDSALAFNEGCHNIDLICSLSPGTKIYVQSVLPTQVKSLNESVKAYNTQLKAYCNSRKITFMNIYSAFLYGDKLDSDLTIDGIHLSETGYFVLKKSISPYLK